MIQSKIIADSGSIFYRIPGAATTASRIVVTYDQRNSTNADLPNNIDVMSVYSTDNGITWSTPVTVSAHTGGSTQSTANGSGDSSLVYNPTTGRLFCFYNYSPATIGLSNSDNTTTTGSTTTLHPCYRYSDDQGSTWSAQNDIIAGIKTSSMYGTFSAGGGAWFSSGTLYVCYTYNTSVGGTAYNVIVAYSTDNGATWNRSSIITGANESHVIKRSDGTFLVNSRPNSAGSRLISTISTLSGTWSSNSITSLPDPACNGSILVADPTGVVCPTSWLLASGCASTASRLNLTVWLSKDNGSTWTGGLQIYSGSAAYSTLTPIGAGKFLIVWENNDTSALQATQFSLSQFA